MCEDYPCCGHEQGYCNDTESQYDRDVRYAAWARRMYENDYFYYGYP